MDILPSIIRTIVPLLAGLVINWLVSRGIDPGPYQDFISTIIAALASTALYGAIRFLETRSDPRWGWLLGLAKAPTYAPTPAPAPAPVIVEAGPPAVAVNVDPQLPMDGFDPPAEAGDPPVGL